MQVLSTGFGLFYEDLLRYQNRINNFFGLLFVEPHDDVQNGIEVWKVFTFDEHSTCISVNVVPFILIEIHNEFVERIQCSYFKDTPINFCAGLVLGRFNTAIV